MALSEKQIDYIVNSNFPLNISVGQKRSGKTHSQVIRTYDVLYNESVKKKPYLLSAKTYDTLRYNIIDPLRELNPSDILKDGRRDYCVSSRDIPLLCVGADNVNDFARIQGITLQGWSGDEMTLHPETFVDMANSQCNAGKSYRLWALNPDNPSHYIKKRYIDNHLINKRVWNFTFEDNPTLTEEMKENIRNSFSGAFYDRYVRGIWAAAEGAVYDKFSRSIHCIDTIPYERITTYGIGIDWGYHPNPLALVLIGTDGDCTHYIIDELYLDRQIIDQSLIDTMTNRGWIDKNIEYVVGDPSRPEYLHILSQMIPKATVYAGHNEVVEGIQYVQRLMQDKGNGERGIYISNNCTHSIEELEGYKWKERGAKDEPIKEKDHLCDAIRYYTYTMRNIFSYQENTAKIIRKMR
jgi:PBSX family phage terminase large subunit